VTTLSEENDFAKVVKVFDEFGDDLLTLNIPLNNKMVRIELQNLLSLNEHFDNPNALSMMADKLPSMLVAFGLELIRREEEQTAFAEEIDLFVQEKWQDTLEQLTRQVDALSEMNEDGSKGKKIPSGLKAAPTKDGIRASIIMKNRAVWDDLSARKSQIDRWVKQLTLICKGIELRGRLLNSQLNTSTTMVRSGINR
jgi:hypothetical protein